MKDFDFKNFLLHRGEQVGLGVAVLLAAILLLWGSKGFLAKSASATAKGISEKSEHASRQIESSTPPADLDQVPTRLLRSVDVQRIDPQLYELVSSLIPTTPPEDTKRRNPEVLSPRDFHVRMIRAIYLGYLLNQQETQIFVIKGDGINNNLGQGADRFRPGGGLGGPGAGGFRPGGGDEGGSPDSGGGAAGIGGGEGGAFGPGQSPNPLKREAPRPIDIDKIANNPNTKFVEQLYPYHVAVVSAAFPYKQQLENFRKSLIRKGTMNDLYAAIGSGQIPFQFVGLDIQRRVTLPSGKIKDESKEDQGWKSFNQDFQGSVTWLYRRAARFEPEDPKLLQYGVIREGLVMARPAMGRGLTYPTKEAEIPSIEKTINDLEKAIKEKNRPVVHPRMKRFDKTKSPFNPFSTNPLGDAAGDPNQGAGMSGGGGDIAGGVGGVARPPQPGGDIAGGVGDPNRPQEEPLIPEHVLVRFLDLTVLPGHSYEYRIRIKMANPNYGKKDVVVSGKLAKDKELVAEKWEGTEGHAVRVPDDQFFYAVDERSAPGWQLQGDTKPALKKENTPVQIHRWLPNLPGDRDVSVGNWILLERALVHRGEYLGRVEGVDVPVWDYAQETDVLAAPRKGARSQQRVPVDFRVRSLTESRTAMLVDFEGGAIDPITKPGSRSIVGDQAAVQMLVQAPDGRLIARNSYEDTENEERKTIHSAWRDWIKAAREGRRTSGGTDLFNPNKGSMPRGGSPGKPGGGGN